MVAVETSSRLKKRIGREYFRVSVEVVLDATALIPILNPDDDTKLFKFVDGAPASIKLLLSTIQGIDEGVVVNVPFDEEVFREAFCLPIFKEDIIEFCTLQKIGAVPITLYMRYLHYLVTQYGYQTRYMFMDPSAVATEGGPHEDRAISLATRMLSMENKHQFLITPWNHGDYWMLLLIYPLKDYAWFLDPLTLALRVEIGLTMIE
ncbi:hypothetical protein PanWU01x14_105730 [Parasponia andersonii]|uniref:Ulp1 protease family, C-terminal catalytic domain containing protein n=1 Tax=Parasponia andersonii TaxID=3476 RepID=A0A2P5D113_PARAD|nr:hypothetical protein PanWU01x14_105730 [Parasponia andersonii]